MTTFRDTLTSESTPVFAYIPLLVFWGLSSFICPLEVRCINWLQGSNIVGCLRWNGWRRQMKAYCNLQSLLLTLVFTNKQKKSMEFTVSPLSVTHQPWTASQYSLGNKLLIRLYFSKRVLFGSPQWFGRLVNSN